MVDQLRWQLRHAVRSLRRAPGFTLGAIAILTLATGANTLVFSLIDAALLRPLPFPDPDRLVHITQAVGLAEPPIAPVRLEDWNGRTDAFAAIGGYYTEDVSDTSRDLPERVRRAMVSPRFLQVWGVAPAIGRDFSDAERRVGGPPAVIVSDRYWRTKLSGDEAVLDRQVRIGNTAIPIVGVMPATFLFPERDVDLWFPVRVDAPFARSRSATWFVGIGRLRPGVAVPQAQANLNAVQEQLAAEFPTTDRDVRIRVQPLRQRSAAAVRGSLWLAYGGVTLLLLVACTNVAGLMLARAAAREPEIATRLALGASRASVAVPLLLEAVILAAAGGILGLAWGPAAASALHALAGTGTLLDDVRFDWRVAGYTAACAGAVAALSALAPAVRTFRRTFVPVQGRRTAIGRGHRVQWACVALQVSLAVVLLSGAGLLVRSAQALAAVAPGFSSARVLTFRVSGSYAETTNRGALVQRLTTLRETLSQLPGVESVATAAALPGVPTQYEATFTQARDRASAPRIAAEARFVSPEYFETLRVPLLAGERCRVHPVGSTAPAELLVNRRFVEQHFAGAAALGVELVRDGGFGPERIVGIVGDARERGIDQPAVATAYTCTAAPNPTPYFLVRTSGNPGDAAAAVRRTVKEVEPLRSVYELAPLDDRIGGAFAAQRLRTVVLAVFAAGALLLSGVGLYATVTFVTMQQRRDIGLRLALGATRTRIVREVMAVGVGVAGGAAAGGLVLARFAGQVLTGMLYGVTPADPGTITAVGCLVVCVCASATLVPALRAAFVPPLQALRED